MTTPTTTDEQLRIRCARLMGWTCKRENRNDYGGECNFWTLGDGDRQVRHDWNLPNYPADLTAAFQLVDALAKDGWTIEMIRYCRSDWQVTVYKAPRTYAATNPSLAVAIATAFIRVKEAA